MLTDIIDRSKALVFLMSQLCSNEITVKQKSQEWSQKQNRKNRIRVSKLSGIFAIRMYCNS